MDENKKDDMLTEEAGTAPEAAEEAAAAETEPQSPADSENALEKELEEIRDMFQQELDKAENGEELQPIQELEDIAEDRSEEEPEIPARICECCGESACSEDYGEDYPYCDSCRELMKRYPLRASGVIMTLLMIVAFVVCAVAATDYADDFMAVSEYAAYYDSGKTMSAITGYYNYVYSAEPAKISKKAVNDIIEGFMTTGYITDAASLIGTLYDEDDLKKPWNKKYADILEYSEVVTESYYAITEVVGDVLNRKDYDYDKVMKELDDLHTATVTDEEGNEVPAGYNPAFIEYYRYVVMSINGRPIEEQLAQLVKTSGLDADDSAKWVYLSNFCAVAAKCGQYDLVESLFNQMLDIDTQNTEAYISMANYYRYLETPMPEMMLAVCEDAKKAAAQGDTTYLPTMAIAYMLQGEGAIALETMEEYFTTNGYSVQTCNLYALCGLYNGNEDVYNEMKDLLEGSGYDVSDIVKQYKKGKITIEEALTDKGGDI